MREMKPSAEERLRQAMPRTAFPMILPSVVEQAYRDGTAAERARWMEAALYDPLMEGPKFKGWNVSALNRLRIEAERALADEIEKDGK